jgi:hypothetical protein
MKAAGLLLIAVVLSGCASAPSGPIEPATPRVDYSNLPERIPGHGSYVAGVDFRPGLYDQEFRNETCEWYVGDDGVVIKRGTTGAFSVATGQTVELYACSFWLWLEE